MWQRDRNWGLKVEVMKQGEHGEERSMPGAQPAAQLCYWAACRGKPAKEQLEKGEKRGRPTGPLKVEL